MTISYLTNRLVTSLGKTNNILSRSKTSLRNCQPTTCLQNEQKRYINLQEYQSKQILHEHGVQVQRFKVVSSLEQAEQVMFPEKVGSKKLLSSSPESRWSGFNADISKAEEFVIKAQVLAGGRGKGLFKTSNLSGGVQLTQDRQTAVDLTARMLNDCLVTKQTSQDGVIVNKVMIAEAVRLKQEFYLAIVLDRSFEKGPMLIASPYGGMDIEEAVAKGGKEAIRKFTMPLDMELDFDTARRIAMVAFDLNMHQIDIIDQCARELMRLHSMFLKLDALQIEINPLGVTKQDKVICVDAKINFDENARFRHKWLNELEEMNESEEDQRERAARKFNLNFIGLDGDIGCLVNGAGLAMATMDIIKLHGGNPANFLDVGGGATAKQVTEAFRIISSDPKVRTIFVNIFGGIMRCDTIAEGIVEAAKSLKLKLPIVCRLQGTRVDVAREILRSHEGEEFLQIKTIDDLDEAAKTTVSLSAN